MFIVVKEHIVSPSATAWLVDVFLIVFGQQQYIYQALATYTTEHLLCRIRLLLVLCFLQVFLESKKIYRISPV